MKQTPIPEKIYSEDGTIKIDTVCKSINSLIDVLTEQQKDNELLERRLNTLEHWIGRHDKGCACQGTLVNPQLSTAMRSTGENYCKCEEPDKQQVYSAFDGKPYFRCENCDHKIKPQQDVRESDIYRVSIAIFESEGWTWTSDEANKLARKILAIVKGE